MHFDSKSSNKCNLFRYISIILKLPALIIFLGAVKDLKKLLIKFAYARLLFLEKEEDPWPLHLHDACSHFINYSQKTIQRNTTVRLKPPSRQHLSLLLSS